MSRFFMICAAWWILGGLAWPVTVKAEVQPAAGDKPQIALLYNKDPETRIQTIRTLSARGDHTLIDDLIRAHSVEFYTPVQLAYATALRGLAKDNVSRGPSEWKAWLNDQVAAGRLHLDYLPIDLAGLSPTQRDQIQLFALRLTADHFDAVADALTNRAAARTPFEQPLRWMIANDHLPQVQSFLGGPWLERVLAEPNIPGGILNAMVYQLHGLANPGEIRDRINAQIARLLESTNSILVANALHMLAGVEGFSARLAVPGITNQVRKLVDSSESVVSAQARRALEKISPEPPPPPEQVSFAEAFRDLYQTLGRDYPCFALKGIDWKEVGEELLPRAEIVTSPEEFGALCMELVARLEDSHAYVMNGTARLPNIPFPQWDPGFACLVGDDGSPVVYHVDRDSPAERAGVQQGMMVLSINGQSAENRMRELMRQVRKYRGYSSERYLRYHAAQWLGRQMERDATVAFEMRAVSGETRQFELPAALGVRYLPRLPVPIPGIRDSGDVSWTRLTNNIGYIYVRRIGAQLVPGLDRAVAELKDAKGLIIDVRGNSGGGFDGSVAFKNFTLAADETSAHPRFTGPMALLIDPRCISAGEGWASWFIAQKRARVFGEATAGASARKTVYTLKNGMFKVQYPVKAYTGFLDRPIERRGLEPDVPVRQNARDLAAGRDSVLEAARQFLEEVP